jgi:oxalate decarboxylase/phosphoglucose isomerase-like protein (cupin superfamily)
MVTTLTHKELQPVLMDPKTPGVKEPYFVIQGENGENITVLAAGKNGIEYNKTLGAFHTFPGVEIYHCLYGQGILIMQRNDSENEAKEIRIVSLRPGSSVEVPAGYGHCIINTGKSFLVVADNAPQTGKVHNSDSIVDKKGLAYYVIDKKGNISFEANSNYSFHPQISTY